MMEGSGSDVYFLPQRPSTPSPTGPGRLSSFPTEPWHLTMGSRSLLAPHPGRIAELHSELIHWVRTPEPHAETLLSASVWLGFLPLLASRPSPSASSQLCNLPSNPVSSATRIPCKSPDWSHCQTDLKPLPLIAGLHLDYWDISLFSCFKKGSVTYTWGFPDGASGKEPTYQCRSCKRRGFDPWVGKIPWRREWQPSPVFLPGESHGQRGLVSCSPQSRTELDMTEATLHASTKRIYRKMHTLKHTGPWTTLSLLTSLSDSSQTHLSSIHKAVSSCINTWDHVTALGKTLQHVLPLECFRTETYRHSI